MMLRVVRYVLLFWVLCGYRTFVPLDTIHGSYRLELELLAVILIAWYRGPIAGGLSGWLIGFLVDCLNPALLGWNAALGALLGWFVGYFGIRLFLEKASSRWLFFWLALTVHQLVFWSMATHFDFGRYWRIVATIVAPSVGLTALVGVAGVAAWRRLRAALDPEYELAAPRRTNE